MTAAVALLAWFFIVDFPQLARFLTEDEKNRVIDRLNKDRGDGEHDPITASKVFRYLLDWKLWGFALIVVPLKDIANPSSLEQQPLVML